MRSALCLLLLLTGIQAAYADDCQVAGPRIKLDSEPVNWTFAIGSGQSCLHGLRTSAMTLDSVRISTPAKVGEVTTRGYSFAYKAPVDFKGEDEFAVTMSGAMRRVRGTSTIRVRVHVR